MSVSDYDDEVDETGSEDEGEENVASLEDREDPEISLIPAREWIRTVIAERKKTPADEKAQKPRLTEEDVDKFLEKFQSITNHMAGKTPTILHAIFDMVDDDDHDRHIKSGTVKALVKRLALQATHLLCIANEEGKNPLYLAIIKKKKYLADYMVADFLPGDTNRQHLINALEDCRGNEQRKNCLHLAFEKALEPATLERMVKSASSTALDAVDNTGRRPMHYAVQYKHCSVEVIHAFLAKDDEERNIQHSSSANQPSRTFLDVDENAKTSVYREHVLSAKAHEEEHILKREISHRKERSEDHEDGEKDAWDRWDEMAGGRGTAPQAKSELGLQFGLGSKSATLPDQLVADLAASRDMPNELVDEAMMDRQRKRESNQRAEAGLRHESEAQPGHEQMNGDRQGSRPPGGRGALPIQTNSTSAINTTKALKRVPTQVDKNSRSKPDAMPKRNNTIKRTLTVKQTNAVKQTKSVKRANAVTRKPRKTFDPEAAALASEAAARASETVLRMLKLHYMRTRSIEKATSWLYETNPEDVQTFFDYRGLPSEINEELFKRAFDKAKFDEVLSSVHFPPVTVSWRKTPKEKRPIGGPSRQDMKLFFDFLYKNGVRYILKVVVEEGAQSAHSDDAIKEVLGPIIVEHLDWRKVDMDPELICGISSQAEYVLGQPGVGINPRNQIRHLDLHWSGNNAALRAWSESEGLTLLHHLQIVNIVVSKDIILHDSDEWLLRKKKEFEERLNKQRLSYFTHHKTDEKSLTPDQYNLKVTVNLSSPNVATEKRRAVTQLRPGPTQGRPATAMPDQDVNEHEWLKCTDEFATSIRLIWFSALEKYSSSTNKGVTAPVSDHETTLKPAIGSGLESEVIVALIDDGVSLLDQFLAGHVLEGKTFDYGDYGIIGQSYNSAQGHGTEMARCILRVCPMAKIYPIRLKTHLVNGRSQIVLKSAALAINAALEKNATIISMSWTIPVPTKSSPEKLMFEDAMRKAASRNVLMFCSSPDEGKFQTKYYPSATQPDKVFRIGAAYDDGGAFRYAGKDVDFIFPGVEVSNNKTSATGSSIATALAAGLAATIIYCFKISALAVRAHSQARASSDILPPTFTASAVRRLSERDVMKTAFSNIGRVNEEKFIQIWDQLRPVVKDLEESHTQDNLEESHTRDELDYKVQRIMKLCNNLRVL